MYLALHELESITLVCYHYVCIKACVADELLQQSP